MFSTLLSTAPYVSSSLFSSLSYHGSPPPYLLSIVSMGWVGIVAVKLIVYCVGRRRGALPYFSSSSLWPPSPCVSLCLSSPPSYHGSPPPNLMCILSRRWVGIVAVKLIVNFVGRGRRALPYSVSSPLYSSPSRVSSMARIYT